MNKFVKSLLITSGFNILLFALGFIQPGLFLWFFILVALEFIIGLGMLISKETREIAKGILVAAGVTFLIGFSVCSSLSY